MKNLNTEKFIIKEIDALLQNLATCKDLYKAHDLEECLAHLFDYYKTYVHRLKKISAPGDGDI